MGNKFMRIIALLVCFLTIFTTADSMRRQTDIDKQYSRTAAQIVGSTLEEGQAYEKLAYLSDRIGNRLSGSPQLDQAIEWAVKTMKEDGLENVHTEAVMVPHWVRGAESAEIISPAHHRLTMLGLGGSLGTPAEGIT